MTIKNNLQKKSEEQTVMTTQDLKVLKIQNWRMLYQNLQKQHKKCAEKSELHDQTTKVHIKAIADLGAALDAVKAEKKKEEENHSATKRKLHAAELDLEKEKIEHEETRKDLESARAMMLRISARFCPNGSF